eukprot:TRINITY_DN10305_c0_g1_i2.p1 TRINITY_DN10305_c0_g1~~TRINITY_DN10305_c0_g1_i2.p1  ORF type:complete len:363 (+),score=45.01 TRINITY_DN10305_c0_g1_i2:81-1169(+)
MPIKLPKKRVFPPGFWRRPKGYWDNIPNQRLFFERVGTELGLKSYEAWYDIRKQEITLRGGHGLLKHHNSSPLNALKSIFPEYDWIPWKLKSSPLNYWSNKVNRRKLFDWIGSELGFRSYDDWYESKKSVIGSFGGERVMRIYRSIFKALIEIYPEYDWIAWKFNVSGQGIWNDFCNRRDFFDRLGFVLRFESFENWRQVQRRIVCSFGGSGLVSSFYKGSVRKALISVYPEYDWSYRRSRKAQRLLFNKLREIIPSPMHEDYSHMSLNYLEQTRMQIDIFFPKLNLGFEYQGIQHYQSHHLYSDSIYHRKLQDNEKKKVCKIAGITLIEIPFYLDLGVKDLRRLILQHRCDVGNYFQKSRD